jgi:hypothetical protein
MTDTAATEPPAEVLDLDDDVALEQAIADAQDAAQASAAAQAAAVAAEEASADLERQILDPELADDVTPTKLVKAENESRMARLRAKEAARKAARAAERARRREVADFVDRAKASTLASQDEIIDAEIAVYDAARRLTLACVAHDHAAHKLIREGRALAAKAQAAPDGEVALHKQQLDVDGMFTVTDPRTAASVKLVAGGEVIVDAGSDGSRAVGAAAAGALAAGIRPSSQSTIGKLMYLARGAAERLHPYLQARPDQEADA